ncbi:MAG: molybdate ABC transporter substrate-binding protein [Vulcanimicrobiaceae bacterium]
MLASLLALTFGPAPVDAGDDAITVFAAASLREAFEAAAPEFTKRTGTAVVFDFGGSDTLATQILQGAPASVFAAANDAQMKRVVDAGLAAMPARTFARNRLVVIVPAADRGRVRTLADLGRPRVTVVLAASSVPAGGYARAALAMLHGRAGYGATFAADVEKNVVSNELDVKAVATKIALGEADAGIVYATDVTPAIVAKVRVVRLPPAAASDADYPIAPLASAPRAPAARAFVDFMLHDGQRYLRRSGFLAP